MPTMTSPIRTRRVRIFTMAIVATIPAVTVAGEPAQPVVVLPVTAWPAPTSQAPRLPFARFRPRWSDLMPRKVAPLEMRQVVPIPLVPTTRPRPAGGTIPKEYLDAIAYQIAQIRFAEGSISEDELFARAASLFKTLKTSPPVEAELAEIRSLVRLPEAPAPAAYATSWTYPPLMVHICNGQCNHR